ncbi:hypothetical protein OV450_8158 [Actinobacteria bacterium OV450]|nr:hypothetical protein OV450_8158 [Actinobacteria bacterium OV450]
MTYTETSTPTVPGHDRPDAPPRARIGHGTLFTIAVRFALTEHARNGFALFLAACFMPVWLHLAHILTRTTRTPFHLSDGGTVVEPAHQVAQIAGALNVVAILAGFMMFAATFTSGGFDRRLAMGGYPRTHLALAKATALTIAATVLSAYAAVIIRLHWTPHQPVALGVALFSAALTYGFIGVALGSVLRRDVEGMFVITIVSAIDITLQNPTMTDNTNAPLMSYLPAHGAVQAANTAAFTTTTPLAALTTQAVWCAAAAVAAYAMFRQRTRRARSRRSRAAPQN